MNVDKWINEIIMSRKCYALPIMTHPGIELRERRCWLP